ncbi:hypothetical protein HDU92_003794 [Lobulomyces angularis]|nr:hypothetical protein HDU92_003794 [Lobulomyces angularis]
MEDPKSIRATIRLRNVLKTYKSTNPPQDQFDQVESFVNELLDEAEKNVSKTGDLLKSSQSTIEMNVYPHDVDTQLVKEFDKLSFEIIDNYRESIKDSDKEVEVSTTLKKKLNQEVNSKFSVKNEMRHLLQSYLEEEDFKTKLLSNYQKMIVLSDETLHAELIEKLNELSDEIETQVIDQQMLNSDQERKEPKIEGLPSSEYEINSKRGAKVKTPVLERREDLVYNNEEIPQPAQSKKGPKPIPPPRTFHHEEQKSATPEHHEHPESPVAATQSVDELSQSSKSPQRNAALMDNLNRMLSVPAPVLSKRPDQRAESVSDVDSFEANGDAEVSREQEPSAKFENVPPVEPLRQQTIPSPEESVFQEPVTSNTDNSGSPVKEHATPVPPPVAARKPSPEKSKSVDAVNSKSPPLDAVNYFESSDSVENTPANEKRKSEMGSPPASRFQIEKKEKKEKKGFKSLFGFKSKTKKKDGSGSDHQLEDPSEKNNDQQSKQDLRKSIDFKPTEVKHDEEEEKIPLQPNPQRTSSVDSPPAPIDPTSEQQEEDDLAGETLAYDSREPVAFNEEDIQAEASEEATKPAPKKWMPAGAVNVMMMGGGLPQTLRRSTDRNTNITAEPEEFDYHKKITDSVNGSPSRPPIPMHNTEVEDTRKSLDMLNVNHGIPPPVKPRNKNPGSTDEIKAENKVNKDGPSTEIPATKIRPLPPVRRQTASSSGAISDDPNVKSPISSQQELQEEKPVVKNKPPKPLPSPSATASNPSLEKENELHYENVDAVEQQHSSEANGGLEHLTVESSETDKEEKPSPPKRKIPGLFAIPGMTAGATVPTLKSRPKSVAIDHHESTTLEGDGERTEMITQKPKPPVPQKYRPAEHANVETHDESVPNTQNDSSYVNPTSPVIIKKVKDSVSGDDKAIEKNALHWLNFHLASMDIKVDNLYTSLKDGLYLIYALEKVTGESVGKYQKRCMLPVQRIDNIAVALNFLSKKGIPTQFLTPQDTDIVNEDRGKILSLFNYIYKKFPL